MEVSTFSMFSFHVVHFLHKPKSKPGSLPAGLPFLFRYIKGSVMLPIELLYFKPNFGPNLTEAELSNAGILAKEGSAPIAQ